MAFSEVGNFVARGADKVDPRLIDILRQAAEASGANIQAYSGFRPGDPRFHGRGMATDIRILDDAGKPLPNYQSPQTFDTYEKFAKSARQIQMEKYPDLDKQFRWGGYFSGGPGKYGAMDLMHFDLGGSKNLGMAGGSWDAGLNDRQAALYGLQNHKPAGLENLTVPADQRSFNQPTQVAYSPPDGPKGQEAYLPPLPSRTINDAPIAAMQQAPQAPQQGLLSRLTGGKVEMPQGLMQIMNGGGASGGNAAASSGGGLLGALAAMQPSEAPQIQPMQAPQGPTLSDYLLQFMQSRMA